MTNPFRGLFRPTPEDRAALDVVRLAMEDVRVYDDLRGRYIGWRARDEISLFYYNGRSIGRAIWVFACSSLVTLELRDVRIPLTYSARRELRRMVREFRVRLAMEATKGNA